MPDFFKQTEFASVKLSVGKDDLTGLRDDDGRRHDRSWSRDLRRVGRQPPDAATGRVRLKLSDGPPGMRPPVVRSEQRHDCRRWHLHGERRIRKDAVQGLPAWLAIEICDRSTASTSPTCPTTRAAEISRTSRSCMTDQQQELIGTVVMLSANRHSLCRRRFPEQPSRGLPSRPVPQASLTSRLMACSASTTLPSGGYLAAAFETIDQDVQWDPEFREAIRDSCDGVSSVARADHEA